MPEPSFHLTGQTCLHLKPEFSHHSHTLQVKRVHWGLAMMCMGVESCSWQRGPCVPPSRQVFPQQLAAAATITMSRAQKVLSGQGRYTWGRSGLSAEEPVKQQRLLSPASLGCRACLIRFHLLLSIVVSSVMSLQKVPFPEDKVPFLTALQHLTLHTWQCIWLKIYRVFLK